MGLLDSLGGSLRNVAAAAAPALIDEALKQTKLGNLQGIVSQLQQGGSRPAGSVLARQWRQHAGYPGAAARRTR